MAPVLNANELRWLGEAADGQRGETYALVWTGEKVELLPLTDVRSKDAQIHVRTEYEGNALMGNARASLKVGDETIDPNTGKDPLDAVFLTQSAVEKFVFPYYTRMQEISQIQELKNRLFADGVVAVGHVPPSITGGIRAKLIPFGLSPSTGKLEALKPFSLFE